MKKHVNPAKFMHKVYTEQKGVKEYNKNQQAIGALKFAGTILALIKLGSLIDKIENLPIKALKRKDEEPPC